MNITMSWYAHAKIMHWIKKADNKECSGFGMVEKLEDRLHVSDVFMIEQVNSGGETEMKPEAIAKEMFNRRNEKGEMNFWWHSHHKMEAYMSKTDVDTIREFGANGWLLATVFNVRNEHKTVLYTASPFQMYLDQFPLQVLTAGLTEETQKLCDKEFEASVTEKKYGPPSGYLNGSGNGKSAWDDWRWVVDGWIYEGAVNEYNENFMPPMPQFLSDGIIEGRYEYDFAEDKIKPIYLKRDENDDETFGYYKGVH